MGKPVMLSSTKVGLGDNSKLVGTDVFCVMVGDTVELGVKVLLEVAKLVGELDVVLLIVGGSVMFLELNVGFVDN